MKKHDRRAMVQRRNSLYAASKFEFDAEDGRGVQWQRACRNCSVEESVALFLAKGYTIVGWQDDVRRVAGRTDN